MRPNFNYNMHNVIRRRKGELLDRLKERADNYSAMAVVGLLNHADRPASYTLKRAISDARHSEHDRELLAWAGEWLWA